MFDSNSKPRHHPNPSRLMDYASGSSAQPVSLLIASHLTWCADCRKKVGQLEKMGGALLEQIEPSRVSNAMLTHLLAKIEQTSTWPSKPVAQMESTDQDLPIPLLQTIGRSLENLDWRNYGSFAESRLMIDLIDHTTRLVLVKAGRSIPSHVHMGQEMTLVLRGGFSDSEGQYLRGDVTEKGPNQIHQPVADLGEDCLCLVVSDAPIKLTGVLGRFFSLIFRT